MIYDAFMFLDEFDLLEIRLRELQDVVDVHVIVEANRTFSNIRKPFHFDEQAKRFEPWMHKIRRVKVTDVQPNITPAERDEWNRNKVRDGLGKLNYDDAVILSDVDEIPRASVVKEYKASHGICCLMQTMYRYFINHLAHERWTRPKIVPGDAAKNCTAHWLRWHEDNFIENAGWHFTGCGGPAKLDYKLKSFAHAGAPWHDAEVQGVRDGSGINPACVVPIDETYPSWVQQNVAQLKERGLIFEAA